MSQFSEMPMEEFQPPAPPDPLPVSARPEDQAPTPLALKEFDRQVGDYGDTRRRIRSGRKPEFLYHLTWQAPLVSGGHLEWFGPCGESRYSTCSTLERLIQGMIRQMGFGRTLNWDGSCYRPSVWEDHEKDLAELSRCLPGWIFGLRITPVEGDGQIRKAFRNGLVADGTLDWSYPADMDSSPLPPRSPQPFDPEVVTV